MTASLKACEQCPSARITIGKRYESLAPWRRYVGAVLIFLPLVVSLPFVLIGAFVLYAHLWVLGAEDLKGFWDFVPKWSSHRYQTLSQQVAFKFEPKAPWASLKSFWMFNCNIYCPLSVGLYEWSTYLVKAVENFWCPFFHELKHTRASSPIDQSYWHIEADSRERLTPEDRDNPIWNADAPGAKKP